MRIMECTNVKRAYRLDAPVLAGATFAMESGEVVGLLGRLIYPWPWNCPTSRSCL